MHHVQFLNHTKDTLTEIDESTRKNIFEHLDLLADDPHLMPGVKKIAGTKNEFRIRVGRWRILYVIDHEQHIVQVIDIFSENGTKDYRKERKKLVKQGLVKYK